MTNKRIVIIGAGASGYFTAIRLKELNPSDLISKQHGQQRLTLPKHWPVNLYS